VTDDDFSHRPHEAVRRVRNQRYVEDGLARQDERAVKELAVHIVGTYQKYVASQVEAPLNDRLSLRTYFFSMNTTTSTLIQQHPIARGGAPRFSANN